jgi:hypothetical protein
LATTYKSAQVAAAAADVTTYATLYTSTGTQAIVSTITVCNTSASNVLYRIGLMGTAGTPAVASGQFMAYDATIAGNDTVTIGLGQSMDSGEFIRVSAASTAINFTASVAEVA